jgi:predicted HAD superfamily phosphohydrolase YqeG
MIINEYSVTAIANKKNSRVERLLQAIDVMIIRKNNTTTGIGTLL